MIGLQLSLLLVTLSVSAIKDLTEDLTLLQKNDTINCMQDKYNTHRIFLQIKKNISKEISQKITQSDIHIFDEVDSTNTIARECAEKTLTCAGGAAKIPAPFSVFIADRQTAGRGRLGRSFFSPSAHGIYMSVLFFPQAGSVFASPGIYTCAAAVAVCEAIETRCGAHCGIKWVNDVYLCGKKICGI